MRDSRRLADTVAPPPGLDRRVVIGIATTVGLVVFAGTLGVAKAALHVIRSLVGVP